MTSELVSVIIPTFNRADLLKETLDSLLAQTYAHWECIVVDDGSTDQTPEILTAYVSEDNRFQYHNRPRDRQKGGNASRNYGFEMSKGALINWIDSDDIMAADHLSTHVSKHRQCDASDMTVSNGKVFKDTPENLIRDWSSIAPKTEIIADMIAAKTLWQTGCVVWKRTALPGRAFHEDLSSSQEWTFHLTQLIEQKKYEIIDETTFFIRDHEQRIGTKKTLGKCYSTYRSRRYIFELLLKKNKITADKERSLLHAVFSALRDSVKYKYYGNALKIIKFLLQHFPKFKCKNEIIKVLLIALPVYIVFRRGEKLFRT